MTTKLIKTELVKPEYRNYSFVYCQNCSQPMTGAKVYECGHTVCGLCSMIRNQHCPACGQESLGPYGSNALEEMLKTFLVDYNKKVEQDKDECEKFESIKTYQLSARYAALETFVLDLLLTYTHIDDIMNVIKEKDFLEVEAKFCLQNLFSHGYFALLGTSIIPKGTITVYIDECWDLLSNNERFYLYIISTSAEKTNWYKVFERLLESSDLGSFTNPENFWLFETPSIDARNIDLEHIPYDHVPINTDYSYETQSEWSEIHGFTDDEEEDSENYVSGSDDDDDDEATELAESDWESESDGSESDGSDSEIELVNPTVNKQQTKGAQTNPFPAFSFENMMKQVETMTKSMEANPDTNKNIFKGMYNA